MKTASHSHLFRTTTRWTGNRGTGTSGYGAYDRNHIIEVEGKPPIAGSSDASFRGDPGKHTPEDMLVSALSTCHMLWYLHICADHDVVVMDYTDHAEGVMIVTTDGSGHFESVTLHPVVTIKEESMRMLANALHVEAKAKCFIANSVNFPVFHKPVIELFGG